MCKNFQISNLVGSFEYRTLRYWGYFANRYHMHWAGWVHSGLLKYLQLNFDSHLQRVLSSKLNAKPLEDYIPLERVSLYNRPGMYMMCMVILQLILLLLLIFNQRYSVLYWFKQKIFNIYGLALELFFIGSTFY